MKSIIALACFLAFAVHATPEHDVKPPKAIKSARATSASTTGPIGITNTVGAPSAVFGQTGGNVAGSGNAYVSSERSAPPVSVGAPSQPLTSCRLGFSGGGSNTSGALGIGLVLGNDSTCLVGAKLAVMDRVGGFSADERRQVACEIEGMDKLATCKSIAEKSPAVARVEPLLP